MATTTDRYERIASLIPRNVFESPEFSSVKINVPPPPMYEINALSSNIYFRRELISVRIHTNLLQFKEYKNNRNQISPLFWQIEYFPARFALSALTETRTLIQRFAYRYSVIRFFAHFEFYFLLPKLTSENFANRILLCTAFSQKQNM